jgi:hypothetical protein
MDEIIQDPREAMPTAAPYAEDQAKADLSDHHAQPAKPPTDYPAYDAGLYDELEHDHAHDVCATAEACVFGEQQRIFATLKHTAISDVGFPTYFALINYSARAARRFSENNAELKRVFRASHITRIMFAAKVAEEHPSYYRAMLKKFDITEAKNTRSARVAIFISIARLCTVKAGEELGEAYEYTRLANEAIGGFELCAQKSVVVSFDDVDAVRSVVANVTSAELMKIGKEVIANEIALVNPPLPPGKSDTGEDQEDAETGLAPGREALSAASNNHHIQSKQETQAASSPAEVDDGRRPSEHSTPQPGVISQDRAIAFADTVNLIAGKLNCSGPILLFGLPISKGKPIPIYREATDADTSASEPLRVGEITLHFEDPQ